MPRRERLSPVQRSALMGIPTDREGLSRHYMLNAHDRSLIAERRGDHNRLGIGAALALLILLAGYPRSWRSSRHLHREKSGRVHPITFCNECTARPISPSHSRRNPTAAWC
jgi:hypothetical protein